MGAAGFAILLAGSLMIGVACRLIGHARERYEWEIGTVFALYGSLFASAVLGSTSMDFGFVIDGLYALPALAGGVLLSAVMEFVFRKYGSPLSPTRRIVPIAEITATRRVKFAYSPTLLCEPVIYQMRRQFGVSTTIGRAEIRDSHGWIEVEVVGAPPALDAALALAQRNGVQVEAADEPREPAMAAA